MASGKKKGRLYRLEQLAMITLHAFPTLYCRSKSLKPGTQAANLFDLYHQELEAKLSKMPAWQRWFIIFVWPLGVILLAVGMTIANGASVSRRYHRSIISQFIDQIRLAFVDGVVPYYYYSLELHEPENRRCAHEYLQRTQLKTSGLYAQLYRPWPERRRRAKLLSNKRALDRFCRQHRLPTAKLVASVENGQFTWTNTKQAGLPQTNLFVKPWRERGGNGAERWLYRNGGFIGKRGCFLKPQELIDHLAKLSLRKSRMGPWNQSFLIQECLVNHRELCDLTAGAFSTLRMYTFWNENGEVEHIASTFRTSQEPESILDLAGPGALAARIDPATGILGRATDPTVLARRGWLEKHPVTGAPFAGRRIPFWHEAIDLVRSAHRQLDAAFLVGWDIGITDRGPVIIEGNKSPDVEIEQRLGGPWGNRRFGELLLFSLKQEKSVVSQSSNAGRERAVKKLGERLGMIPLAKKESLSKHPYL